MKPTEEKSGIRIRHQMVRIQNTGYDGEPFPVANLDFLCMMFNIGKWVIETGSRRMQIQF
jgi:hypothetical protein